MTGWIKLHRSILEWGWYSDINTTRLFVHLLLKASHKDIIWRGINIKRGQLISGRNELIRQTGLTAQQLRTATNKLKSTSEITVQSTNRYSLYTIENYEEYQSDIDLSNQQNNQQPNNQATNNQPASNHIQEYKEIKNNKNEENINTSRDAQSIFDFWCLNLDKSQTAKLTPKRKKCIEARLKEGYTIDEIKKAIIGCSKSAYHMGQNDTGAVYDDLTLICRSGDKLEAFIGMINATPKPKEPEKFNANAYLVEKQRKWREEHGQ